MRPAQRLLAVALAVSSLTACSQPKGYDQMDLRTEEIGEARLADIVKPPAKVGEITTWRTTFPGQIFAATRIEAACPRDIPTVVGVKYLKDRIELCYTVTPRNEPIPGFGCSQEVYLKYEIMGMPPDVEPKFVFVGNCF